MQYIQKRTVIGLAIVFYLALESYYLFFRFHAHMQDLALYRGTALEILSGQVPFRDFNLEYPLFALIPILLPGWLSAHTGGSLESYVGWFITQNLLVAICMGMIVRQMDRGEQALRYYAAATVCSLPVFLFRFDAFPAMLTLLAVGFVVKKPGLSGMALMASVAAQLYAVVLVPVLGLYYLFTRNWRGLLWQIAGFVGLGAVIVACIAWLGMDRASGFMNYHLLRGIQIESLTGGILLLLDQCNLLHVGMEQSFGAMHLVTPLTPVLLPVINAVTPVCFMLMVCYLIWAFQRSVQLGGTLSLTPLIAAAAAQILLFILLNKVLSPQYLVWLLPLVPFCGPRTSVVFIIAVMLTVIIFPGHYYGLVQKQLLMVVMLNLRNGLLVWLFARVVADISMKAGAPMPYRAADSMRVTSKTSTVTKPNSSVTTPRIL